MNRDRKRWYRRSAGSGRGIFAASLKMDHALFPQPQPLHERNVRRTGKGRITSYNVCYTKLLRIRPVQKEEQVVDAGQSYAEDE